NMLLPHGLRVAHVASTSSAGTSSALRPSSTAAAEVTSARVNRMPGSWRALMMICRASAMVARSLPVVRSLMLAARAEASMIDMMMLLVGCGAPWLAAHRVRLCGYWAARHLSDAVLY